ncbi:MAG: Hsp20/alpha crystallin family protein [Saprospiraceae bacterium]|nr:Hsp20/alpha crystallin family protein [Saprospiraceae bacterium]
MTVLNFQPGFRVPANRSAFQPVPDVKRVQNTYRPPVNVLNDEEAYTIQLAVPGYDRDAIQIEVDNGTLSVKGADRKATGNYTRKEFKTGAFERRFQIPDDADSGLIEAKQENGVLTILLPKVEAAKPRSIQVA